ncbi:MAG: MATE family efflux transporter [Microcoleaceae cyanobacterium]
MTTLSVSPIRSEITTYLKLAVPLVSAQIAQGATGFVDTVMMGHLGWKALAAGGLASFTYQVFVTVISGIVMSVSPLVAEAYGAGGKTRIEQLTRQGLWLAVGLSILTMMLLSHLDRIMLSLGQAPETVALADTYLNMALWGLFPAVGFAMLRGVISGLSQARPIMLIVIGGTLLNIIGNYILGFGKLGFPRMELAGLALASALSWWVMFAILLVYLQLHPKLRKYRLFQKWYQLKLPLLGELIILGMPIGVSIALEYGSGLVMAYLIGILGTHVLAAHQIALQTGMLVFMIPLGMSYATTARIGQWFGRRDLTGLKRAGYVSGSIILITTLIVAISIYTFRVPIVGLYIDLSQPENAQLLKIIIPMLSVMAIGQVFDGLQKTVLGGLYGLQDTRIPAIVGAVAYLGVGLTCGYVLSFPIGLGGVGMWIGYYVGSIVAATVYIWRFSRLISKKFSKAS